MPTIPTETDNTFKGFRMPIFKIEPMKTSTTGGFEATITGINTGSSDFISGTIENSQRTWNVSWDKNGLCRDNAPSCNLDTDSNEFIEVINAAKVFLPLA